MTLATPTPEQDDRDPLAGLRWADDDTAPACPTCHDTGWRWTVRARRAVRVRCTHPQGDAA